MRRLATLLSIVWLCAAFSGSEPLGIGSAAPMTDLQMTGIDGERYTLAGVKGENGLLVIFNSNTCPWVRAWESRYPAIAEQAQNAGVGAILINSNEGERDGVDSMEKMRERAAEQRYSMPYVVDLSHRLADSFGATRTPEVFLFDASLKLVYRGAIDDDARNPDAVEQHYLMDALKSLGAGEAIATPVTRSMGCEIKRTT